jgi:fructokinase
MSGPVVGIGELLWDIYPDGRKVAGGAPYNFAFHCHQLGHEAVIVSRVGDDDLGKELREAVKRAGMTDEFVQVDRKRFTGTVRVTTSPTDQPSYTFATDPAWGYLEWSPAEAALAGRAAAVCHGTLALQTRAGRSAVETFTHRVESRGGLVVYDVNLRPGQCEEPNEMALFRAHWLKVNSDELGPQLCKAGASILDDDFAIETEAELIDQLRKDTGRDDRLLIVTRGASGAELFGPELIIHDHPPAVTVADTVGAGDAFTAAMVCLHLEGRPLKDCARFANYYAARVCEHVGATPIIDRAEVERTAFG